MLICAKWWTTCDVTAGKSAVTIQFAENHFAEAYNPTIENTFHKTLKHKGVEYELEIIDTVRGASSMHLLADLLTPDPLPLGRFRANV